MAQEGVGGLGAPALGSAARARLMEGSNQRVGFVVVVMLPKFRGRFVAAAGPHSAREGCSEANSPSDAFIRAWWLVGRLFIINIL